MVLVEEGVARLLLGLDVEDAAQLGPSGQPLPLRRDMLPVPQLLEQPKYIFRLRTLILFEGVILGVQAIREGRDEVLDFLQHCRTDIKLDIDPGILLLLLRDQVGHLQLDLAELGYHVVESVAKDWVVLLLVDLEVQLLEELVLSFYQLLLADAEENCYLGGQAPELFVVHNATRMGVVLLPEVEAVLELEDVD